MTKNITRTFYGIGYLAERKSIKYFIDAQKVAIIDKKQKLEQKGFLVTPVYQKRYSVDYDGLLSAAKAEYRRNLEEKYNRAYFGFLQTLKQLPGVVDKEQLRAVQQQFINNVRQQAAEAV